MNYIIIANEKELNNFINTILPDLEPNECFYVCLLARNKYCKELTHIKSDKAQLKRFTCNKDNLVDKLKQLECPIGSYKQKTTIVPQEAIAAYITINPRSLIKAAHRSLITLSTLIANKAENYNPHQQVMSEIQKSCSRKVYTDFDFDFSEPGTGKRYIIGEDPMQKLCDDVVNKINPSAISIIGTRGGAHVLVKHSMILKNYTKSWHSGLVSLFPD